MNAGAQALLSAELGGEDFFGYFLGHKKVTRGLNDNNYYPIYAQKTWKTLKPETPNSQGPALMGGLGCSFIRLEVIIHRKDIFVKPYDQVR
jgi:hypothetical protein